MAKSSQDESSRLKNRPLPPRGCRNSPVAAAVLPCRRRRLAPGQLAEGGEGRLRKEVLLEQAGGVAEVADAARRVPPCVPVDPAYVPNGFGVEQHFPGGIQHLGLPLGRLLP